MTMSILWVNLLPVEKLRFLNYYSFLGSSGWRSRFNNIGSKTRLVLGIKNEKVIISEPGIENSQNQSEMSNPRTENSTIIESSNFPDDPERFPEAISKICEISRNQLKLSSVPEKNEAAVGAEDFNSSKTMKSMETIGEIATETKSQKPNGINNGEIHTLGVIEKLAELEMASKPVKKSAQNYGVQPIVDFGTTIEKERPLQFEFVKASREEFSSMKSDKHGARIIKIDDKVSPLDAQDLSVLPALKKDTYEKSRDIPLSIMDEIRQVTKPKLSHTCSKSCPCKFSQELINIYHEAKLLTEVAKNIAANKNRCKFRMTSSEVDFFKGDNKICNVIIGETQTRRAEMRELMDMWQEADEKLTIRKKETVAIAEIVEGTTKRMEEIENLLSDWLPAGQMEKLRKAQRAAEKRNQERIEIIEDETRIFCQKKIEEIIQKRDSRQAEDRSRENKRKNQRQNDTLSLQNATNLLQKYIDQRKSLLIR